MAVSVQTFSLADDMAVENHIQILALLYPIPGDRIRLDLNPNRTGKTIIQLVL